jgi:hypothetical protein
MFPIYISSLPEKNKHVIINCREIFLILSGDADLGFWIADLGLVFRFNFSLFNIIFKLKKLGFSAVANPKS